MSFQVIAYLLSRYLLLFSAVLLVPLSIAAYFEYFLDPQFHPQPHSTQAFFESFLCCLFVSSILWYIGSRLPSKKLLRKEGIFLVVSIWFVTGIFAALPLYFNGTFDTFLDCYFEAISGLTTTGATLVHAKAFNGNGLEIPIINQIANFYDYKIVYQFFGTIDPIYDSQSGLIAYEGIDAVSRGILFWRSMMQWIGGMGIVVLFVAILPMLGFGGKVLFQSEVPGPDKEGIAPRIARTALILWGIYCFISFVEVLSLRFFNSKISIFEAVVATFSTVSTGGFSIYSGSVGTLKDPATEWVIIVFMLLGSINFGLYYWVLRGRLFRLINPELGLFLSFIVLGSIVLSYQLIGTPQVFLEGVDGVYSLTDSIRNGVFQLVSSQTSTGFVTANYDAWPYMNQVVMLIFMFIGGMSGSTAGGIKVIRYYVIGKILIHQLESLFRPYYVKTLKVGNFELTTKMQINILIYFLTVMFLSVGAILLFSFDGNDPETALSVTACMINNIGIAFRAAGPTESFAFLSPFSKILSIFLMVLGRLEFFVVLTVLTPNFWKRI